MALVVKNLPDNAGDSQLVRFDPWIRKIHWRRKWQSTPVFLPGKFHGHRSLVDFSPWGHKESDKTEHTCGRACAHTHTHTHPNPYTEKAQ